jgi:D-alanine-D-alanine ligase
MRVAIVHNAVADDAPPDERDVLDQVAAVEAALRELRHDAWPLPSTLDLDALGRTLADQRADVVFNVWEGYGGFGRTVHLVPTLFDALGVPYTGAPADAILLTSHKLLAKERMAAAGIATPPVVATWPPDGPTWPSLTRGAAAAPTRAQAIVKSVWEHASVGIDAGSLRRADDRAGLHALMAERAPRLGGECFAETFVEGREFNVSVLGGPGGPEVMALAEIAFVGYDDGRPRIVDYAAKWDDDSFEGKHTVRVFPQWAPDDPLPAALRRSALACWRAFGLRGHARVDFRVDAAGLPWVLEVNANPCISPDAGFAAAVGRSGHTYRDAIARILADAHCRGGAVRVA